MTVNVKFVRKPGRFGWFFCSDCADLVQLRLEREGFPLAFDQRTNERRVFRTFFRGRLYRVSESISTPGGFHSPVAHRVAVEMIDPARREDFDGEWRGSS